MVTGFNHNIKHNGVVYHIQTEDSGVKAPHIITHLFVGGNIIATKKTSYSDLVGSANLPEVVRRMMEEQHKQMLRNLIHGAYDQAANESAAPAPAKPKSVTQTIPRAAPAPVDIPTSTAASATPDADATANPFDEQSITPPEPPSFPIEPELPVVAGDLDLTTIPGTPVAELLATPPDLPAVELAADPATIPGTPLAELLPPPPLAEPAADERPVTWTPIVRPVAVAGRPSGPVADQPPPGPSASVRPPQPVAYSLWDNTPSPEPPPEVVAARALQEKPVELPVSTDTIFGEDLLDEKSLDEVILSYLADDSGEG